MIKIHNLKLPFDHQPDAVKRSAAKILGINPAQILSCRVIRRSLDARARRPLSRVYTVVVELQEENSLAGQVRKSPQLAFYEEKAYQIPSLNLGGKQERPLVVGTGPAGLFAGLLLAEAGLAPLMIERGKPARERVQDVSGFWKRGRLDPESNVQFGEGGAGTFSDGKLTTRVKEKFRRREKILRELVAAGAPEGILIESKPHVGTANLVRVVENLREKIECLGGEYRFGSRVDDLIIKQGRVQGVVLSSGEQIAAATVILAIGHSARDTFAMLVERGVHISPKPFSIGFRIEHAQQMIDQNQYGTQAGHPDLGAADYQLSWRGSLGRTVYSFCMCPGGQVIGASSEIGGLVTNGMSQYARDGVNANSAIVAEVFPSDFPPGPLEGFKFQREWEQRAYELGGGNYFAPVQLAFDFLQGRESGQLGAVQPTFQPGIRLVDLSRALPEPICAAIKEGLLEFEKRLPGFAGPDAVLTGIETRTSCPLRINRNADGQSTTVGGLYPVGEGSGYAGGIMSSAIDGLKAAEKILAALASPAEN